jgi:RND family efflux transporter MFP subunit
MRRSIQLSRARGRCPLAAPRQSREASNPPLALRSAARCARGFVPRVDLLAAMLALLAACAGNQYEAPPPPEVTVALPVERDVTTYGEFTGRTVAVESVDVRARVQGILQKMSFKPGTEVKQGELLFVIEPTLYEARFQQAEADLVGAEARARAADEQLAITEEIFQRKAGSKADLVQKTETRDEARAAVARARADLTAAKLDLSYTHLYAPISGRIDRNYVDLGNLVGAGEPTLLATIVREKPIFVYFSVSERDLLVHPELLGGGAPATGEPIRVQLGLGDEPGFPRTGTLDYTSNRVDPSTGTIEIRAVFPNADGRIVPGLFVRVRVPFDRGPALLVPDEATQADQDGRYVLVVGANDVVEQRSIQVGPTDGEMRVVSSGLTKTDRVVVIGLQRARPGAVVKPTLEAAAAATSQPLAPAAALSPTALPTAR